MILALLALGRCSLCNTRLKHDFHADHIVPFSIGGSTALQNGQALCAQCNLRKGTRQ
ncbi:MAG TPA: hypothetical protein DCX14_04925 [Flavobacteriales bacterium]|nr:hypothetical protein [Flavobacteriales bacterium]